MVAEGDPECHCGDVDDHGHDHGMAVVMMIYICGE